MLLLDVHRAAQDKQRVGDVDGAVKIIIRNGQRVARKERYAHRMAENEQRVGNVDGAVKIGVAEEQVVRVNVKILGDGAEIGVPAAEDELAACGLDRGFGLRCDGRFAVGNILFAEKLAAVAVETDSVGLNGLAGDDAERGKIVVVGVRSGREIAVFEAADKDLHIVCKLALARVAELEDL